ncbi:hypothetical protein SRABI83_00034 [Arthrobacter sp. Bi83]|nr:hypothetical protein SRABI83_00034 [Arthrobacter sp. Bi83]
MRWKQPWELLLLLTHSLTVCSAALFEPAATSPSGSGGLPFVGHPDLKTVGSGDQPTLVHTVGCKPKDPVVVRYSVNNPCADKLAILSDLYCFTNKGKPVILFVVGHQVSVQPCLFGRGCPRPRDQRTAGAALDVDCPRGREAGEQPAVLNARTAHRPQRQGSPPGGTPPESAAGPSSGCQHGPSWGRSLCRLHADR